jgi:tetratricopeptide (TPR) repeat protein
VRALQSLADDPLVLASLSAGVGYQLGAGPRLAFIADLQGGAYFGTYGSARGFGPLVAADVGLAFALSPAFRLGLGASGSLFLSGSQPLYSGLGIHLSSSFTPGAARTSQPKLQIIDPRFEPVFPVFFKWYDSNPAGTVVIVNKENREIRNVKASIFVREFMDAPKVFAEIPVLAKGEAKEVPVQALLTDSVLGVTESTKVAAEIEVSYELGNGTLKAMRVETLRVLDRNAMSWADDQRAASFVTAKDPVILALAKDVAGAVREAGGAGSDLDLRIAMGIYQALGLYGMKYVIDPASSYADFSKDEASVDFLQFPRQSLQYRSGDCDDLTILYAALLESVGLETAFITVPGHILAAVALPMTPDEAERTFSRLDRYIVDKGKVYIPVETTIFSRGFNAAWAEGARQWRLAGTEARLIPVREAWKTYEAVGLREEAPNLAYPAARAVVASYKGELDRFVSDELVPQVARLQEEIKRSGASSRNLNRLGVLYARYGKYPEAEAEFQKVTRRNEEYVPTLVNLANIALIRGDAKAAAAFYDRALRKEPNNKVALAGVVRVRSELGDSAAAQNHLAKLQAVDPVAAASLAPLASGSAEGRASAGDSVRVSWSDE